PGASTENHALYFFSSRTPSRHIVDKLFHVHAQGHFVNPRPVDVSRDAQHPGAAVSWRAAIRVRVASLPDDRWHGAQRFHVIDNRWAAVQSHHGWERRFDARVPTLAFQRF